MSVDYEEALAVLELLESTCSEMVGYMSHCIYQEQKGAADPAKIEEFRARRKHYDDLRHQSQIHDVEQNRAVIAELSPQVRAFNAKLNSEHGMQT